MSKHKENVYKIKHVSDSVHVRLTLKWEIHCKVCERKVYVSWTSVK